MGNMDVVRLLVEMGARVNTAPWGTSPLHCACDNGSVDVVEYLLRNGADPNATSGDNDSAFARACSNGHAGVAQALLEHGAETTRDDYISLAFEIADSPSLETIQIFLQHFLVFDSKECHITYEDILRAAMLSAAGNGNLEVMRWVYDYVGTTMEGLRTEENLSLLEAACVGANLRVVEFLLDHGWESTDSDNLLEAAAASGSTEIINLLLSRDSLRCLCSGAKRASKSDGDRAFVECAALLSAAESDKVETVRALLDYGARVDSRDGKRKTALHYACEGGMPDIVQVLLEAGADIDARCATGLTPMDYAYKRECHEVVELLRLRRKRP
ncbi:ankyrin repeat-containing domain protein [Zopfochytrium polystomum]|nr:ankyrin repeat-containing domain protein [Zopfochytrium polystomum]